MFEKSEQLQRRSEQGLSVGFGKDLVSMFERIRESDDERDKDLVKSLELSLSKGLTLKKASGLVTRKGGRPLKSLDSKGREELVVLIGKQYRQLAGIYGESVDSPDIIGVKVMVTVDALMRKFFFLTIEEVGLLVVNFGRIPSEKTPKTYSRGIGLDFYLEAMEAFVALLNDGVKECWREMRKYDEFAGVRRVVGAGRAVVDPRFRRWVADEDCVDNVVQVAQDYLSTIFIRPELGRWPEMKHRLLNELARKEKIKEGEERGEEYVDEKEKMSVAKFISRCYPILSDMERLKLIGMRSIELIAATAGVSVEEAGRSEAYKNMRISLEAELILVKFYQRGISDLPQLP